MKRFWSLMLVLMLVTACAAAGAEGGAFSLVPITWDTATLGVIGLPAGYSFNRMIYNCDESTCLGYPVRVKVVAYNSDKNANMQYFCGEQYLWRISGPSPVMKGKEGELDAQTAIFLRPYHNAAEFCDAVAFGQFPGTQFVRSEDSDFYKGMMAEMNAEFQNEIVPTFTAMGNTVEWTEFTAAQRYYTYEVGSERYALCVMATVRGYQFTAKGYGFSATSIVWDVPSYYILTCPIDSYEEIRDGEFRVFTENTIVNDEFKALNDYLNEQIRDEVIRHMNMVVAQSSAYMAAMTALTFSMVESQMGSSYGTYSSDRFSDYMFDQNDYTLSDGSSVKVSTGYSYVWEGDNGTVYYGNSLLDEPGGATQLYPNR